MSDIGRVGRGMARVQFKNLKLGLNLACHGVESSWILEGHDTNIIGVI